MRCKPAFPYRIGSQGVSASRTRAYNRGVQLRPFWGSLHRKEAQPMNGGLARDN